MKHRSVIAFVIVAAALFSLPQLSHDLRALKGEVGARLHRELLHAFLSLPADEPLSPAPAPRAGEPLLASCPNERRAAKQAKAEAAGRAEGRTVGRNVEQSAMIDNPANDPINQRASVEVKEEAVKSASARPEVRAAEVAMIIPPDVGIDPRAVADALKSSNVTRLNAEGVRVAFAAGARFEARGPEWQRATAEAVRRLNGQVPGTYEFRVVRDGARATKVLKIKCGECPVGAPRAPRQPQPPPPFTSAEWASE